MWKIKLPDNKKSTNNYLFTDSLNYIVGKRYENQIGKRGEYKGESYYSSLENLVDDYFERQLRDQDISAFEDILKAVEKAKEEILAYIIVSKQSYDEVRPLPTNDAKDVQGSIPGPLA